MVATGQPRKEENHAETIAVDIRKSSHIMRDGSHETGASRWKFSTAGLSSDGGVEDRVQHSWEKGNHVCAISVTSGEVDAIRRDSDKKRRVRSSLASCWQHVQ